MRIKSGHMSQVVLTTKEMLIRNGELILQCVRDDTNTPVEATIFDFAPGGHYEDLCPHIQTEIAIIGANDKRTVHFLEFFARIRRLQWQIYGCRNRDAYYWALLQQWQYWFEAANPGLAEDIRATAHWGTLQHPPKSVTQRCEEWKYGMEDYVIWRTVMNCHPPSSLYRTIRLDVYEGGQLIFTNKGKGHQVLYITYSGEIETTIPGVSFDKELLEGLFTLSRKEGFTTKNEKIQKFERETQMGRFEVAFTSPWLKFAEVTSRASISESHYHAVANFRDPLIYVEAYLFPSNCRLGRANCVDTHTGLYSINIFGHDLTNSSVVFYAGDNGTVISPVLNTTFVSAPAPEQSTVSDTTSDSGLAPEQSAVSDTTPGSGLAPEQSTVSDTTSDSGLAPEQSAVSDTTPDSIPAPESAPSPAPRFKCELGCSRDYKSKRNRTVHYRDYHGYRPQSNAVA
ncbi:hypothetical protein CaCOL14_000346 [Colletotrichum acutatum]